MSRQSVMPRLSVAAPRTTITPGFNLVTGSYNGNAVDDRAIFCGFQPSLVIVKGDTNQYGVFRTSDMPTDESAYFFNAAANFSNGIQSFSSTGFVIGTSAVVNSNNVKYHWIAISDGGAQDFRTFTYTGTGAALSVGIGWQPSFVVIKRNGASSGRWRDSVDTGTTSHYFVIGTNDSGGISAIGSEGFTVASGSSQSGDTYYGFAFRDLGNSILNVGSYTGTGADDRSVTGVGFLPAWVLLKNNTTTTTTATRHRFDTFGTDKSSALSNSAITGADTIQAFEADGFQVGTADDSNKDGDTVHYVALKKHRERVASSARTSV